MYYTILQYLQDNSHNRNNNKNHKNVLHRGSCTPCRRLLIRKISSRVKTTFKGTHNLN